VRVFPGCDRVNLRSECGVPRAESRTGDGCASTGLRSAITRKGSGAPNIESRRHATGSRAPAATSYRNTIDSRHRGAGSRRSQSAIMLPLDRTSPVRAGAARRGGRLVFSGNKSIRATVERHNLARVRDDLRVERNNLAHNRNGFSARAIAGTRDASSPARPVRAGCVSVLSHRPEGGEARSVRRAWVGKVV
jgi:hypothetical protein